MSDADPWVESQTSDIDSRTEYRDRFLAGEFPVAVYGLGKMGLPLAAVFAETCSNVIGVDIDPDVVEAVNRGRSHIDHEPGLAEVVSTQVDADALSATTDATAAASEASIHVIIVPTLVTDEGEPDMATLDAVIESIAVGLSVGDLVCIESTVPPRTAVDRVVPALERLSDLATGDFSVAVCPERTASGTALRDIRGQYPKVVGGVDALSTERVRTIYELINDKGVLVVSDATTAECVKVFEGVYRDVNIALANELARMATEIDIDVTEAIEIANTTPFCDIHDPGPGVGGHCIPYYPYFLIAPFESETSLLERARAINDSMPAFTVDVVLDGLDAADIDPVEATVAILGLTYRPGVNEIRASPALDIVDSLRSAGVSVFGVDSVVDDRADIGVDIRPIVSLYETAIDAVVLVTPHADFDDIDWGRIGTEGHEPALVVDGRNTLPADIDIDARVYTIGAGIRQ